MYFSGNRLLETIVVAPCLEGVYGNSRREFGLLENLQNVVILFIVIIALRAAWRNTEWFVRGPMVLIAASSTFLFVEEIDYGLHWYEYLAGIPGDEAAEVRNLHNLGDTTSTLKTIGDVTMVVLFVVAPFALRNAHHPVVRIGGRTATLH